ncbi:CLUMA_CG001959, isoform A [Clunio marinus]|uniref:CLUMA_CG001959, isoform A n=1 Tax=Clunio marinus TaxID=568069 RepID=A0A1J1HNX3_9DIPT|nr:CLUMA_CG001959, isoform A [Clunio marinus]
MLKERAGIGILKLTEKEIIMMERNNPQLASLIESKERYEEEWKKKQPAKDRNSSCGEMSVRLNSTFFFKEVSCEIASIIRDQITNRRKALNFMLQKCLCAKELLWFRCEFVIN